MHMLKYHMPRLLTDSHDERILPMWVLTIHLDCTHPLVVTHQAVIGNKPGLWYCFQCRSGNHTELAYP